MARSNQSLDELHALVNKRLGDGGQIYTRGRRRLVELLAGASRPVTMPELLAAYSDVAISSAYRNLAVLEQVDVVTRITGSAEHARFELSEAVMGHHHHHLICTLCGRVEDFTVPQRVERTLERALADVAQGTDFTAAGHRLDLVGTCGDCRAES